MRSRLNYYINRLKRDEKRQAEETRKQDYLAKVRGGKEDVISR